MPNYLFNQCLCLNYEGTLNSKYLPVHRVYWRKYCFAGPDVTIVVSLKAAT